MDLIYIRRKYRNIKRIIIFSFILTVFMSLFLLVNHVYAVKKNEEMRIEEIKKYEYLKQKEEEKAQDFIRQQEEEKKKYILNSVQIEAIKNIYKSDEKQVFLTFDDGPSKSVTIPILDLLKSENIKANFFVLGNRVDLYPDIVKRAYEEGHYIGNHGYSHKYSQMYSSANSVLEEYNKTNQAVKNAIGNQNYNTNIFRFPGGSVGGKYNDIKNEAKTLLEQNSIACVDWNALNGDSEGLKTEQALLNRLQSTTKNKNSIVILMHDAGDKENTYNTLPQVINYLKQEGYQFKNFYNIINKK